VVLDPQIESELPRVTCANAYAQRHDVAGIDRLQIHRLEPSAWPRRSVEIPKHPRHLATLHHALGDAGLESDGKRNAAACVCVETIKARTTFCMITFLLAFANDFIFDRVCEKFEND
jgi:hypothetical protein